MALTGALTPGPGEPEVGFGGVSVLSGLEVQPLGIRKWTPALGIYGRGFFPFEPVHQAQGGRPITIEFGGRARYGPFLFQYSYYQPTEGLLEQALPIEGSTYAEAYHILTLGMTFDAITKLAFR